MCAAIIWPLLHCLRGNWGSKKQYKTTATLATATAVNNKLSFVSDPEVLCLVPPFLKLWQGNLLAYKKSKTLDPS